MKQEAVSQLIHGGVNRRDQTGLFPRGELHHNLVADVDAIFLADLVRNGDLVGIFRRRALFILVIRHLHIGIFLEESILLFSVYFNLVGVEKLDADTPRHTVFFQFFPDLMS